LIFHQCELGINALLSKTGIGVHLETGTRKAPKPLWYHLNANAAR
jgi:hypothetical protein